MSGKFFGLPDDWEAMNETEQHQWVAEVLTELVRPSGSGEAEMTLHVVGGHLGTHIVSAASIAEAAARQDEADRIAGLETFGDLRRSDELDLLADRLDQRCCEAEDYVTAIERAAGRTATGSWEERLAALASVAFEGDDESNAPGDGESIYSTDEQAEMGDGTGVRLGYLESAMGDDLPDDLLEQFARSDAMFNAETVWWLEDDHVQPMIAALKGRGYSVVED